MKKVPKLLLPVSLVGFYALFIIVMLHIVGWQPNNFLSILFDEATLIYICLALLLVFVIFIWSHKTPEEFESLRWRRIEYVIHATGAIAFLIVLIESNNVKKIKNEVVVSTTRLESMAQNLPYREFKDFPENIDEIISTIKTVKDTLRIFTDAPAYGCWSNPDKFQAYEDALNELIRAGKTVVLIHPCKEMFTNALQNQFFETRKIKNLKTILLPSDQSSYKYFASKNSDWLDTNIQNKTYYDMFNCLVRKDSMLIRKLYNVSNSSTSTVRGHFLDSSVHAEIENGFWIVDRKKVVFSFIAKEATSYSEPTFYAENTGLIEVAISKIHVKLKESKCCILSHLFVEK